MKRTPPASGLGAAVAAARATAGLDLLILFGSRSRGDSRPGADWDFGYLADEAADVPTLLATLVEALEDERVDLVDLRRAGGLLRYRAARDGLPLHEAAAGLFDRYRLQAVRFWCENAAVFERGYDEVLEALPVSVLDRAVLAERTMAVQRHLARVADRLPASPADFRPATDASALTIASRLGHHARQFVLPGRREQDEPDSFGAGSESRDRTTGTADTDYRLRHRRLVLKG